MNERIKQLATETDIWCDQNFHNSPEYNIQWEQKFAELIVRECIEVVEQDMKLAHIQMIPLTLEKYANGRLKEKIKKHFGVEE